MNFAKNKALIGFILLGIGTGYAIHGNNEAIQDSKERGKFARGVICNILTDSDKQSYAFLPAEAKALHTTVKELEPLTKKSLEQSAADRRKLAPGLPKGSCYTHITPPPKIVKK